MANSRAQKVNPPDDPLAPIASTAIPTLPGFDSNATEGQIIDDDLKFNAMMAAVVIVAAKSVKTMSDASRLMKLTDDFIRQRRNILRMNYGTIESNGGSGRGRTITPID